jgi:hypothetical protein
MNVGSSGQVCELVRCYDVRPERECIRLASFLLSCGMIA